MLDIPLLVRCGNKGGLVCRYAAAVIDTITSQNIPVHVFADVVPTPLVAHAVSALGCAAGIMVTASHNPAGYNGYKVYYCNGCQIIPPHDAGIASMIEKNLQIWPEATAAQFEEYSHEVGADVVDSYFTYLQASVLCPSASSASSHFLLLLVQYCRRILVIDFNRRIKHSSVALHKALLLLTAMP